MPKASGDTTTDQVFELEELERQSAEQMRLWTARLLGEIEAPGSLADSAARANQVGQVIASLNHAIQGIRLAREVQER
jgi:hypothetical protein